jgi:FKBP12-rapamycin complex-associated protein
MQRFNLVHSLLVGTQPTATLAVRRYAAIPLSTSSGVIGWVPNCETLRAMVACYCGSRGLPLRIEQQLATAAAPTRPGGADSVEMSGYDALPLLHGIKLLSGALSQTSGRDLAHSSWRRSPSAELWLDRRLQYTCSLGTMSMVGYVLGLGDRHPNNLIFDRVT